jgi:vacuolar-type H+-ATPase subunit E/Vma4
VNDYGKPQNDKAQQDEQAHELIEQLNLLEAVDRRLTPEHIARRFCELLDDIGDDCPPGPPPGGHPPGMPDQPGLDSRLAGLLRKSAAESCPDLAGFSGSLDAAIAAAHGAAADILAAAQAKATVAADELRRAREAVAAARQQTEQIVAEGRAEADKALDQAVTMVRDARDQAERMVSEARDQAAQTLADARAEADKALDQAVTMVRDARDQAERMVSEARDQAAQTVVADRNEHAGQNPLFGDTVALSSLQAAAGLLTEPAAALHAGSRMPAAPATPALVATSCMSFAELRMPQESIDAWLTGQPRETDAPGCSLTAAATDGQAAARHLEGPAYLEGPAVRRDRTGVLVLLGDPGTGKSALLEYLSAQDPGARLPQPGTDRVPEPLSGRHDALGPSSFAVGDQHHAGHQMAGGNCTLILTDVVGFGARSRNDEDRRIIRDALFHMTRTAARDWSAVQYGDRGDGLLIVVPSDVPPATAVGQLLGQLPASLESHNTTGRPSARFQLRVAINVGPVTCDAMGISGEGIIFAAGLVKAPVFKQAMSESGAALGIIASPFVYETVIRHDPYLEGYSEIAVPVRETSTMAWMKLFGATRPLLTDGEPLAAGYARSAGAKRLHQGGDSLVQAADYDAAGVGQDPSWCNARVPANTLTLLDCPGNLVPAETALSVATAAVQLSDTVIGRIKLQQPVSQAEEQELRHLLREQLALTKVATNARLTQAAINTISLIWDHCHDAITRQPGAERYLIEARDHALQAILRQIRDF